MRLKNTPTIHLLLNGKRKLLATRVLELCWRFDVGQHAEAEQHDADQQRHNQDARTDGRRHEADTMPGVAELTLLVAEQWLDLKIMNCRDWKMFTQYLFVNRFMFYKCVDN